MNKSLASSLALAFLASPVSSGDGFVNDKIDQDAVNIKAAEAERAFSAALNRLGELINVAVSNNMGPDSDCLLGLFQFIRQSSVFVDNLRQFHVGACEGKSEIGEGNGKLGIFESFANTGNQLNLANERVKSCESGCGVRDVGHNKFSVAIELLRQADHLEESNLRAEPWPEYGAWTPMYIRNLAEFILRYR